MDGNREGIFKVDYKQKIEEIRARSEGSG